MSSEWQSSLCCPSEGRLCYSFCCTPCSNASARSDFDTSNWCFNLLCTTGPLVYNIVREGYGIEGNCCSDIVIGCCLPCCAVSRLHAEISSRGIVKKGMH